ncbi:MAG: hypothetical protein HQL46_09785 [Gammaproteobacteria bacterium]|nr:hypothetical protein [Gammaproteobacteria bacterium]
MGLLDELKQESEKKKESLLKDQNQEQLLLSNYQQQLLPKLQFIYHYFKELMEYLEILQEPITIESYTKRIPGFDNLKQGEYKLSTDKHGGIAKFNELKEINLRFYCTGDGYSNFDVFSQPEVEQLVKFLNAKKVPFEWQRENNPAGKAVANFNIQLKIPVIVKFEVDIPNSLIKLTIFNHFNFDLTQRTYQADEINDELMDQIGKFLLRKSDDFVKMEITDEHREVIKKNLEEFKREHIVTEKDDKDEQNNSLIGKVKSKFFSK